MKGKRMKVCYIYQDEYPWEVRTEKIASTLAKEGIESHIICRNRNNLPREQKLLEKIYVHRLPRGTNKVTRDLINLPAFFSPFWIKEIAGIVKKYCIDLIIVRDLPLSPAAYIAGKIRKIPVIMDMAEDYPAMIRDTWRYKGPRVMDYLIRNPVFLGLLERLVVPRLDGILVVSEFSGERIKRIGAGGDKVWVVGNTPIIGHGNSSGISTLVEKMKSRSDFVLLYVGGLEESRGLDVVISSMEYLVKIMPNILLVIVGIGTSEEKLRALAKEKSLQNHILLAGWAPHEEIPSIIKSSDICLIPHYVTNHTNTTLPNKIFDYMAQKKPVIVTQARALVDVVTKANCGLVYQDKSPLSLSEAVIKLMSSELRETLGLNGLKAIQENMNWNYDKVRLIEAVKSVCIQQEILGKKVISN
jgi:glycosyltransferase involved in cell wall biosynthesis